jgi:predicted Rossmann-fold nucleotide-binding protein
MSGSDLDKWLSQFPNSANLPFRLRPSGLYSIGDLYDTFDPAKKDSWKSTYDYRSFAWFTTNGKPRSLSLAEAIAARLHDATIQYSIDDFLLASKTRAVGFMGGHGALRTDPAYGQIAELARSLRRAGLIIVTGGGPGLMEAANLGAFLGPYADGQLDVALSILKSAPDASATNAHDWLRTAAEVRSNLLGGDWRAPTKPGSANLGIPTWLYGFEPPNLFSTVVGKYFYNSVREDGLVTVASGGLVFGPGEAGTVQEIFQDATLNYYRSNHAPTPMVFLGKDFWHPAKYDASTPGTLDPLRKPVYPLIESLAKNRFETALLLSDDPLEISAFLLRTGIQLRDTPSASFAEARLFRQI